MVIFHSHVNVYQRLTLPPVGLKKTKRPWRWWQTSCVWKVSDPPLASYVSKRRRRCLRRSSAAPLLTMVIRLRMRYPGIPIKWNPPNQQILLQSVLFWGVRGLIAGYTIKSWWSVHPQSIVHPYIYIYTYIYIINPIKAKCLGVWLDPSMKWWTVSNLKLKFGGHTLVLPQLQ